MPILTGFPPSNTISPSVRIMEQDLSFVAAQQTFHTAAIVGFASKGPINLPTAISSTRQLYTTFGNPHPEAGDPYLIYAAQQYLQVASQLYVVRVAETSAVNNQSATTATNTVLVSGGQITLTSQVAEPYIFSTDSFFRWRLNGVLASKTLVVLAGDVETNTVVQTTTLSDTVSSTFSDTVLTDITSGVTVSGGTGTYTAAELADELNSQLNPDIDGIEFAVVTVGSSNYISVSSTFAFGPASTLEFVSVQNSIYGPSGVIGLGLGMTPASVTGTASLYPNNGYTSPGTFDFTGLTGLTLQVVVDGTDNSLIDNIVQVIDFPGTSYSISQIATHINNQINAAAIPGGFIASPTGNNLTLTTLHSGNDAKLLVKTASVGTLMGFTGITVGGYSPVGVSTAINENYLGIASGPADTSTVCFTINADSPGIEGNQTQVVILNNTTDSVFTMNVFNNGVQVESWGNLTKNQQSSYYVESFIATVSSYISVIDNTSTLATPLNGTYQLSGGSDGIPASPDDQDALLIGSPVGYTGLYSICDTESFDIDLLACPGHASTAIVNTLIDVCQNYRQDCLAIIDPPFGLTANEIIAWQNGVHPLNSDQFNSDFAALYWPWLKYRDSFNLVDVWIPPSGSVMATIAISDGLSAPWFAPAGLNRGVVPNILDVFTRPTLAERDAMYGNYNCVNPIITFPDIGGFVIWGQKTMQRTPTALDRVNVRRLMFVVEKQIKLACRGLLFDPNDATFNKKFENICTQILQTIQVGRGITAYIIFDDSTINTPDSIARNEFHAQIGIQPVYAVEFIFIEFSLNATGNFAESTAATF